MQVGHDGGGGATLTSAVSDMASSLPDPEAAASMGGGVLAPLEPAPLLVPVPELVPLLAVSSLLLPLVVPASVDMADEPSPLGSSPGSAAQAAAPTKGA